LRDRHAVSAGQDPWKTGACSLPPSRRPARLSQGDRLPMIRRSGENDPLLPMYTLGHDFVPAPTMPAASAITAWHRSSATWSGSAWSSPGISPAGNIRGGCSVCPDRGHHPGTRVQSCHCRGGGRGAPGQGRGEGKGDPLQLSGHGMVESCLLRCLLRRELLPYELPEEEIERALKAIEGFPKP
jgi:tryptophan synthase beta chain